MGREDKPAQNPSPTTNDYDHGEIGDGEVVYDAVNSDKVYSSSVERQKEISHGFVVFVNDSIKKGSSRESVVIIVMETKWILQNWNIIANLHCRHYVAH